MTQARPNQSASRNHADRRSILNALKREDVDRAPSRHAWSLCFLSEKEKGSGSQTYAKTSQHWWWKSILQHFLFHLFSAKERMLHDSHVSCTWPSKSLIILKRQQQVRLRPQDCQRTEPYNSKSVNLMQFGAIFPIFIRLSRLFWFCTFGARVASC